MLAVLAGAMGAAFAGDARDAPGDATCSGTIRDAKGRGVAGAVVSVEGGARTTTAADGTYAIGATPGDALVTAEIRGRFRVRTLLRLVAGESRRWDATVGTPGVIRGRVVDEYGHPLTGTRGPPATGWHVVAIPEFEWMGSPDPDTWWSAADANGAF